MLGLRILPLLFIMFYATSVAQTTKHVKSNSVNKVIVPQDPEVKRLVRSEESNFLPYEQDVIRSYIATIAPRVKSVNFNQYYLYVTTADDFDVLDLMEGLKQKGFSLVYYSDGKIYKVTENYKIEVWDSK